MKEFDIINKYIKCLYHKNNDEHIDNDCATVIFKDQTVINLDTIVAGRHFFLEDGAKSIAHKIIHSNLSDLASMGANPIYWLLALNIDKSNINEEWIKEFCSAALELQEKYNFYLIGGDTTFSDTLSISATFFGNISEVLKPLSQSGAKNDDLICVSNYIGDAFFGLHLIKHKYEKIKRNRLHFLDETEKENLINAYKYPKAQINLGRMILPFANACTDISDGLWLDLEKIFLKSNVSGEIDLDKLTFSDEVNKIISYYEPYKRYIVKKIITHGDDYQLLFTISKENLQKLRDIISSKNNNIIVQEIGKVTDCKFSPLEVKFNGSQIYSAKKGFEYK